MSGYSLFSDGKLSPKDQEVQDAINEAIEDLEDRFGIVIVLDFWDYVDKQEVIE